MYKKFSIKIDGEFSKFLNNFENSYKVNLLSCGNKILRQHSNSHNTQQKLKSFIKNDGTIDGKKLIEKWFPKNSCDGYDVFISHSHKDRDTAVAFAGFLNIFFGLRCFIDSEVWGYCNDLLQELDNKYNLKEDGYYNYEQRNKTTAYVHNMLCVALADMMNECECIFFLDTDNSIVRDDTINDSSKSGTYSPWLYYELAILKVLKITQPIEGVTESDQHLVKAAKDEAMIKLPVDMSGLPVLETHHIISWMDKFCALSEQQSSQISGAKCLEILYKN